MTGREILRAARRYGLLFGICVAALLSVRASAAPPSDAVLLASTVPGYVPGMVIGPSEKLVLPEGASVTLLFKSGEMLRLKGPFEGVLPRVQTEAGGPAAALAAAFRLQGVDASVIGGTRAATIAWHSSQLDDVLIDPQRSGTYCVQPSSSVWIARPVDVSRNYALRRKGSARKLAWDGSAERAEWPEGLPIEDGDRYEIVEGGAARASITFRAMDDSAPSMSAWIAEGMLRGCTDQFADQLRRLGRSAGAPELWMTSNRGRHPTYHVGEPIGLTVQADTDGYLYCVDTGADGNTVPLFPLGAIDGPQIRGSVPLEIPGHRTDAALRAKIPGRQEVKCWLADRDISPELPHALLSASGERLPDPVAAGLDALFTGIEGSRISRARLTVDVQ
jgi:hypothetical protein